jgi:hypothetical protein
VAQAPDQPKTASAAKPVLVIEPLRKLLAELREVEGNPANGPILRGVIGGSLDLNMLAKQAIRPALPNRKNYGDGESKNWKPLEWQGFYSLRRSIANAANHDHPRSGGSQGAVTAFQRQHNSRALH